MSNLKTLLHVNSTSFQSRKTWLRWFSMMWNQKTRSLILSIGFFRSRKERIVMNHRSLSWFFRKINWFRGLIIWTGGNLTCWRILRSQLMRHLLWVQWGNRGIWTKYKRNLKSKTIIIYMKRLRLQHLLFLISKVNKFCSFLNQLLIKWPNLDCLIFIQIWSVNFWSKINLEWKTFIDS